MNGEKLLRAMGNVDDELILECFAPDEEIKGGENRGIASRKRKLVTIMLAATITFALAAMASAAIYKNGEIDLLNYLGLGDADTSVIEDGMGTVNCSSKCQAINAVTGEAEEVEMTVTSSIGDKRNMFVKIETNIAAIEPFNEERDYYLPEDWISSAWKANGKEPGSPASFIEGRVEDGKVCFYTSIEDGEDIHKNGVTVQLDDIYLYHDKGLEGEDTMAPEPELIYKGRWELQWINDYKVEERCSRINKVVEINGEKHILRDVKVTPLEVNVRAWSLNNEKTDFCLSVESILLKDGTEIDTRESGGGSYGTTLFSAINHKSGYASLTQLGYVLDPDDVEAIVVNEIKLEL